MHGEPEPEPVGEPGTDEAPPEQLRTARRPSPRITRLLPRPNGAVVPDAELSPESAEVVDKAPVSRALVFLIVSMALLMASIDSTIVATALPTLHHDLHATLNWTGWTITAYQLGQIMAMPLAGKLSDQFGRKKIFLLGVTLFTTSSLLCGMSQDIYMLIGLRVVQALGGGAFMPSATGIVADHFGRDRDRAIGMFTSILPLGGIIGPVLGGVFVAYWTWRGIFWINVPIGLCLLVLGLRFIPVSPRRDAGPIDVSGVVIVAALILLAMFGITSFGDGGAQLWSPIVLVPIAAAGGLAYVFTRHAKRAASPYIPMQLLSGKGFGVMNIINLFFGACAIGFGALVPLFAQDRYHIAVLQSGTLLTARAVGVIVVAGLASFLLRRTGYRLPMFAGFLLIAAGLALMWIPPPGMSAYLWLAVASAITGIGIGTASPASNNAILQLAPEQVAAIAGLRGSFRQAGAILAVSVTTAVAAKAAAPGVAIGEIFGVLALILIALLPLIALVPEHKGTW